MPLLPPELPVIHIQAQELLLSPGQDTVKAVTVYLNNAGQAKALTCCWNACLELSNLDQMDQQRDDSAMPNLLL